ncbi:signal peptide, CUB and EGF-like domain-containing protein 1 [Octopus bimaculoides]|uniref:signal peptide, CUB and EGF-like domain-containing protein 1 n=1 Tax=Octopus bimaculoides TaxID=37653 RepID=UPI0022E09147|nr:signal peptide, CUB and EGF-like domain-containing protein 1 [Octopus bimaculoides]
MSYNSDMCESRWCEQGCDENTGRCICRKGYKLDLNEKCADVNECSDGTAQCHAYAGCLNTKGSYQCVCSGEYYGDGQSCQECSAPCEKGMFEVQPCSDKEQKICEECTKDCGKGYYMHRQCGLTFNAKCRSK